MSKVTLPLAPILTTMLELFGGQGVVEQLQFELLFQFEFPPTHVAVWQNAETGKAMTTAIKDMHQSVLMISALVG